MMNRQNAFALYRLPGADKVTVLQTERPHLWLGRPDVNLFALQGFLFYPHIPSEKYPAWLLPADEVQEVSLTEIEELPLSYKLPGSDGLFQSDKTLYNSQIDAIQNAIRSGRIDKAILSRITTRAITPEPLKWFGQLCERYPHVMVCWVHIPGRVSWMTATPEVLLSHQHGILKTMSLAGTQADKGLPLTEVTWGEKERHEQQIVTDYINTLLEKHFNGQAAVSGPKTVSTGHLLHLRTDFELQLTDTSGLTHFLFDFHPTPAISGLPKQEALQVIAEVEQHERAYYTGFLGPVSINNATQLFVNLRCMQLFRQQIALYLGGGITAGSNSSAEWQETEIKAGTLLNVIS